jgi:hypothetical protein
VLVPVFILYLVAADGSGRDAAGSCAASLPELDRSWLALKDAYRRGTEEFCGTEKEPDIKEACLRLAQPSPAQMDLARATMNGKGLKRLRKLLPWVFSENELPTTVHHEERMAFLRAADRVFESCGGRIPKSPRASAPPARRR